MEYILNTSGETNLVKLSGDLTFADNKKSQEMAAIIQESQGKSISFNLSDLKFIDSSGLGMLIKWNETGVSSGVSIKFCQPSATVARTLRAGRLDELLTIEA